MKATETVPADDEIFEKNWRPVIEKEWLEEVDKIVRHLAEQNIMTQTAAISVRASAENNKSLAFAGFLRAANSGCDFGTATLAAMELAVPFIAKVLTGRSLEV